MRESYHFSKGMTVKFMDILVYYIIEYVYRKEEKNGEGYDIWKSDEINFSVYVTIINWECFSTIL